ncbi:MAG TPA: restriction endonuclease [Candidatus Latescibacteria bacterium]|nr:restriction endonuclease [Candidatus Latescibacterota bacterium]
MTAVWCVRANAGEYAGHFLRGSYVAIGWCEVAHDLSAVRTREELYSIMRAAYPDVSSPIVIGNYVGQVARFILEMKAGDYVITPAADTEELHYGRLAPDPSYFFATGDDGCPYRHRRRVEWASGTLKRSGLSVPLQNTIRSSLTVFAVSQREEFLAAIGSPTQQTATAYDPYRAVLERVLQLDDKEFEILVGHLLTALGFDGSEVTGKTGDGGVDATGELNVANLAKIKIFVQAKRYKLGSKVSASVVKQLRASIPSNGQGAFITTADFQTSAADVALQTGFPRIGLVNGRQLVDLLVEHWNDIPADFRDQLGLKPGLVRV